MTGKYMNNSVRIKVLDLIDSGYWKSVQWKEWADAVILKFDEPPYWVIELSTVKNSGEAISILRESLAEIHYEDNINHKSIILGYMFLRYKEKEINLKEFLTLAWQETEAEEDVGSPSNSDIFEMYEACNNSSGADEKFEIIVDRVCKKFSYNAECAAKALLEVNDYK